MGKRKLIESDSEEEEEEEEEPVYYVEVIIKARVIPKKKYEYRVKWADYDSSDNSWEPYENVKDCKRLLHSFWMEIGYEKKNNPGPVGHELKPSEEWIKKERKYFQREERTRQREKEERKRDKRVRLEDKKRTNEGKNTSLKSNFGNSTASFVDANASRDREGTASSDESNDIPLRNMTGKSFAAVAGSSKQVLANTGREGIHFSGPAALGNATQSRDWKGKGKAIDLNPGVETSSSLPSPSLLFQDVNEELYAHSSSAATFSNRTPDTPTSAQSLFGSSPPASTKSNVPDQNTSESHPKLKALPPHVQRQANPKVKAGPMLITNISGQLSTKERITNSMNSAMEPNIPRNKFSGMKIPKKKDTLTYSSDQVPESSKTVGTNNMISRDPRLSALRIPRQSFSTEHVEPITSHQEQMPSRMPVISPAPFSASPDVIADQVDNLLATIAPLSAVAAQKAEALSNQYSSKGEGITAAPVKFKFEKKWKWSGELFVDVDAETAERVCDITITNASESIMGGFRLNILFNSKDSVRLAKVYKVSEFDHILCALRRVDQYAKICETNEEDKEAFLDLVRYLEKGQLMTRAPVITELGHVAELIFFPSTFNLLCTRLDVPTNLRDNGALVVALMPWKITPIRYAANKWHPSHSLTSMLWSKDIDDNTKATKHQINSRLDYQLAIDILAFPEWLVKFVTKRAYCIWAYPVEPMPKDSGRTFGRNLSRDTMALMTVLDDLQAENLGYKTDIRVVFVHVGAVHTIGKLPALVERRGRRPEIQFITYGSHANVEPVLWGIHEIFPIGGIFTFTHTALLEDPWGAEELIGKAQKHPFWDCYILPSVLGLFTKIASSNDDPLAAFDENPMVFGNLPQLIEQGELSLLNSPPLNRHSAKETTDECMEWVESHLSHLWRSTRETLEYCIREFTARHANRREHEIQSAIEEELVNDITNLQTQPAIRQKYRRFVLIKGSQDIHIKWDRDGFEWKTMDEFDFKDDFFPKPQTRGAP